MFKKLKKVLKLKKKVQSGLSNSNHISIESQDAKVASHMKSNKGECSNCLNNCCVLHCVEDIIAGCCDWCIDLCGCGNDDCSKNCCDTKPNSCCDCGVIGCQCDLGHLFRCCF